MSQANYGSAGRIGIITPQSNPTVEPEISLLLPPRVTMHVARCVSRGEPRQRLIDYIEKLPETLERFDSMQLGAVGFACTGSAYMVGAARESALLDDLRGHSGYRVISATGAIDAALKHLGVRRVALASPYPDWLMNAALDYWTGLGYDVVASRSLNPGMADTRQIYAVDASEAREALMDFFVDSQAEICLVTGTGMPGLGLVAEGADRHGLRVLTSNLCLAWKCLQEAGIDLNGRVPTAAMPLLGGWQEALRDL